MIIYGCNQEPATVQYRCIWNKESGEEVSEWASADNLTVTNVASSDVFFDIVPPTFKLVTEDNVSVRSLKLMMELLVKLMKRKKLIILRFYKLYCLPFIIQL